MKKERNQYICEGCKYSHLHHCDKYNEICDSVMFHPNRCQLACKKCIEENGYEEGIYWFKENKGPVAYMHLPGPENLDIFKPLITMKEIYPEAFYDNRVIYEIYGSFGGTIWNGRTPNFEGEVYSLQRIKQIKEEIENLGLRLNLTWNNHTISGTDVYDRFCNAITKLFHNGKHAITVASPELYKYLKENYPNYTYYSSIINTTNDKEFSKKDESFDMYLWPRNLNNNWEELEKVPKEERCNIELLANDACTNICNRMIHYNTINNQLKDRINETTTSGRYCTIDHDFMMYNTSHWSLTINPKDIDLYINKGFVHFKLCSRGDAKSVLALKMARYLAKPEYADDVFCWMIAHRNWAESDERHWIDEDPSNDVSNFKW